MLKCAGCVTCASESKNAEKVRVRACICVHPRFGVTLSDWQFEEWSKTNSTLSDLRRNKSPYVYVVFLVFKTKVGTLDVEGYSDCRHDCDDEESHHEDHDDHCSASGTQDYLVMFSFLFVFRVFFGFSGVAASSLVGLYLVLVSVASRCCARSDVIPRVICHSVKFFHVGFRVSLFARAHLELLFLKVALHDRSVRSFRNFVSLRNPSNLLRSWVFVTLQSFHNVRSFEYSSMHDETMVDALLFLLLDFLGNALSHATTSKKCFAWSLIFTAYTFGIWTRSPIFETSCRYRLPFFKMDLWISMWYRVRIGSCWLRLWNNSWSNRESSFICLETSRLASLNWRWERLLLLSRSEFWVQAGSICARQLCRLESPPACYRTK